MKRISSALSSVCHPLSVQADRSCDRLRLVFGILIGCLLVGCHETSDHAKRPSPSGPGGGLVESSKMTTGFSNDLTADQILKRVIKRYAQAKSYSDKGVLHLNYRLLGKSIQEPHPFEVTWQTGSQLGARIFKGQLNCDGKLLSCYVYDILSGNLDGQQLIMSVENSSDSKSLPIAQLYEDSIVRHYLGGYADLPLDETYKNRLPRLIPPTLSLLSHQLSFGWVQAPNASQRLPDQIVEGKACYVIRSKFDEMTADIWIEQGTDLLVQIEMPLKIMDRQVLTSGEIENVELTIKFHDAQIDELLTDQQRQRFVVGLKNRATPVRRFVKVPKEFPSQLIGEMVPRFNLRTPQGKSVDRLYFDGRPTLLVWVSGASQQKDQLISKLSELVTPYPQDAIRVGVVYSNTEVAESNTIKPQKNLVEAAGRYEIPLYFDQELQIAARFELKPMPVAIVLNPNSRLEFVRSLNDDQWSEDLKVAFDRIVRGERIAEEMRSDYEKFVADYQQQLEAVAAQSLLGIYTADKMAAGGSSAKNGSAEGSTNMGSVDCQSELRLEGNDLKKTGDLKPVIAWKNERLQRPGNLLIDAGGIQSRLYALDGWRTVVELDLSGQEIARHRLELPSQAAVSCLRMVSSATISNNDQQPRFAAFSVQSDRVFLFSADWKLLAMLPATDFAHDGIRDVQFVTAVDDSNVNVTHDLVVAFAGGHGCYRFQLDQKQMTLISRLRADSIAAWQDQVYYANADGFGLLAEERDLSDGKGDGWIYQRLLSLEPMSRFVPKFMGMTLVDRENNWSLARINEKGQIAWRQPVGSQLFNFEVEPLTAGINAEGQILVAVADANDRITLVSGDGRYRGQLSATEPITGIALYDDQSAFHLVIATESGITGYRLISAHTPAIQVSHPQ